MENTLHYKGYIGSVDFSGKDHEFFGRVLEVNGLISYEGKTEKDLVNDFHAAVDNYISLSE